MWAAILGIVDKALGIFKNRQEQKNTADVKQAQKAQNAIEEKNEIEKSVSTSDVDATRRGWSEP